MVPLLGERLPATGLQPLRARDRARPGHGERGRREVLAEVGVDLEYANDGERAVHATPGRGVRRER